MLTPYAHIFLDNVMKISYLKTHFLSLNTLTETKQRIIKGVKSVHFP